MTCCSSSSWPCVQPAIGKVLVGSGLNARLATTVVQRMSEPGRRVTSLPVTIPNSPSIRPQSRSVAAIARAICRLTRCCRAVSSCRDQLPVLTLSIPALNFAGDSTWKSYQSSRNTFGSISQPRLAITACARARSTGSSAGIFPFMPPAYDPKVGLGRTEPALLYYEAIEGQQLDLPKPTRIRRGDVTEDTDTRLRSPSRI